MAHVPDLRKLAGSRWAVPQWHLEKIETELQSPDKTRMLRVMGRIGEQDAPDLSGIDWDRELAAFGETEYPSYYTQPFHSIPGGYLSEAAATGDRSAMQAIYQDFHPRRCLGMRDELANLVPDDARSVLDLGSGTGDAAAALAHRLPGAEVTAIDASPFMTIAARHQNPGLDRVYYEQGFAEHTDLADACVDAVTITLVFHECPDVVKDEILAECRRVLRPGGTLVLSDTPQDDLHDYRGFYEPYKEQWLHYDPDTALGRAGFVEIRSADVAPPLWSRVARNPV